LLLHAARLASGAKVLVPKYITASHTTFFREYLTTRYMPVPMPQVLEVPVPKYFIEDRAKELDDRDKFLEALVDKYHVNPIQVRAVERACVLLKALVDKYHNKANQVQALERAYAFLEVLVDKYHVNPSQVRAIKRACALLKALIIIIRPIRYKH